MSIHDQNNSKNITSIDTRVENPNIEFDTTSISLSANLIDQLPSSEQLTSFIDSDKREEDVDAADSKLLGNEKEGIQVAAMSTSHSGTIIDADLTTASNFVGADTDFSNNYASGGGGASSDGMSPVLVIGLGALTLGGIAAALSGGSSGGSSGGGTVNVDPQFNPAMPSSLNTNEDSPTQFTVAASDANSNDVLTYSASNGANGTISPVAGTTDRFQYTPNANFNGQDTFTVSVTDGNGGTDSQTITVNVTPVNDAPSVNATQNVAAGKNQAVTVALNASDIDAGDTLSYGISSTPSNGTVTQSTADPDKFIYTPNTGFSGNDSFTVAVSDQSGETRSQVITVAVGGNTAPNVDATQSITTNEDQAIDSKVNATDPNGDALSYQITSAPAHGEVVLGQGGNFQYTPDENYFGSDSFDIQVSDGNGGVKTQQINVTINSVNDKPIVDSVQDVNAAEGAEADITVIATDVEGDTLSYTASTPANGTVTNNGDGNFTYTPTDSNFSGIDTFNVDVSDGNGGTSTQVINIIVSPINHNPELLDNDGNGNPATQSLTSNHNTPASFTVSASDSDNNPLNYGVNAPQNGIVVPGNSAGTFTYRPNMGFSGTDSFTVTVSDGNGGAVQQTINVSVADTSGEDHDLIPISGSYTGSDDADTISGVVATSGNTLNDNDDLDGAGGFDRLVLDMRTDFAGFAAAGALGPLTPAGGMSNIESLEITNNQGSITVFDGTRGSGIQYIKLDANDQDFTFRNLNDTNLVFEISDADGKEGAPPTTLNYILNFATSVNNGEDDALTLVLNDVGFRNQSNLDAYGKLIPNNGIRVTTQSAGTPSYDIEHLTLIARAGANQENFIDLTGFYGSTAKTDGIQTLTISGSGNLDNRADQWLDGTGTPSPKFNNLSQVDASTALGDLNLDVTSAANAPAMQSLKAGFGDDVIIAGANIRSTTLLDGGDGKDLLRITDVDDVSGANSATLTPNMRGFETLDLVLTPVTGSPTTLTNLTLSAAKTEGLETLQISNAKGIDNSNDPSKVFNTTIRDLSGQALELKFLETIGIGSSYTGNDNYTVQDSGDLTITTVTQNNNSTGTFADNVTAIAAPKVMINIGDDTNYIGTVTANAAESASISLGSGGALGDNTTIPNAKLSVTSAKNIAIDGATDTAITNLTLEGQNVSDLTITGSVIINGLNSSSNLNSLSTVTSTSLGGIDLTGLTTPFAFGAFSNDVTVNAEKAVVATSTGFGLKADIDSFNSGNGSATILGSKVLNNEVSIGAGRNQIDITTGSGVDIISLLEVFEEGDGAVVNINLGLGDTDVVSLNAGVGATAVDYVFNSLTLSGVETITSNTAGDNIELNASAVSGQTLSFTAFSDVTFNGSNAGESINLKDIDVSAITTSTIDGKAGNDTIIGTGSDDRIFGGSGADTISGGLGNNTYVFNTNDVATGETINFNAAGSETLEVETSTDLSLLNSGSKLDLIDIINILEKQSASFLAAQLSEQTVTVNGKPSTAGDEDEKLVVNGNAGNNNIDLSNITANGITIEVNAGAGNDEIIVNAGTNIIRGGAGIDEINGASGTTNTYAFNTGDIVAGDTIEYTSGVGAKDILLIETSTDLSALRDNNGGIRINYVEEIHIKDGQTATFTSEQFSEFTSINPIVQSAPITLAVIGEGNNGGESLRVVGGLGDDLLDLSNITVDRDDISIILDGGADDDTIIGTHADDKLIGGGGLDKLDGNGGADTYQLDSSSEIKFADTVIHNRGDGVAATAAQDLNTSGISNGDQIGFGNGLDKILDFQDGIDFLDIEVAADDLDIGDDINAKFNFDLSNNFGLDDNDFVVIRGDFIQDDDDVFIVADDGDDLLLAFDANSVDNAIQIEFMGLLGMGGSTINEFDILV